MLGTRWHPKQRIAIFNGRHQGAMNVNKFACFSEEDYHGEIIFSIVQQPVQLPEECHCQGCESDPTQVCRIYGSTLLGTNNPNRIVKNLGEIWAPILIEQLRRETRLLKQSSIDMQRSIPHEVATPEPSEMAAIFLAESTGIVFTFSSPRQRWLLTTREDDSVKEFVYVSFNPWAKLPYRLPASWTSKSRNGYVMAHILAMCREKSKFELLFFHDILRQVEHTFIEKAMENEFKMSKQFTE